MDRLPVLDLPVHHLLAEVVVLIFREDNTVDREGRHPVGGVVGVAVITRADLVGDDVAGGVIEELAGVARGEVYAVKLVAVGPVGIGVGDGDAARKRALLAAVADAVIEPIDLAQGAIGLGGIR
ncbi:hypothetical protein [Yoonia sp. 2307UL14-13]|uniref:hypothetical protein n=1 Tax=Yoonia sp. 2307UL14-13 TaxID=3126506 RepID=UPI00403FD99C